MLIRTTGGDGAWMEGALRHALAPQRRRPGAACRLEEVSECPRHVGGGRGRESKYALSPTTSMSAYILLSPPPQLRVAVSQAAPCGSVLRHLCPYAAQAGGPMRRTKTPATRSETPEPTSTRAGKGVAGWKSLGG